VRGIVIERGGAWRISRQIGQIPALRERAGGAHNQGTCSRMSPMNVTVAKPETAQRLSRAELRERWRQLADNRVVAAIPCKVELNEKGAIEVSPPTVRHAFIQGFLTRELARQRPEGTTLPACPIETDIGMRVKEVWIVDEDGVPEIYTSAGRVSASTLGFELTRPPAD
jgi:hypothetical protein